MESAVANAVDAKKYGMKLHWKKVDNHEPNNLVYVEEISGKGCCYEFLEIR